jgi:glycosyltransferase involved in cell wall biosynthesis
MRSEESLKVSIIIPVFNRAQLLERALNSCISQTYSNLEIIIVDDGSTDNTVEVIRQMQEKDARIKLFENKSNNGPARARNVGLNSAKGDLITFLDSDDYLMPTKISQAVNAFSGSDIDMFMSVYKRLKPAHTEKVYTNISPAKNIFREFLLKKFRWSMIVPVWRSNFLKIKVGSFNEQLRLGEDFEFHFRAVLASPRIHYSESCLTIIDDTQSLTDPFKIRKKSKRINFVNVRSLVLSRNSIFKYALKSELSRSDKFFITKYYLRFLLSTSKQAIFG